MDYGKFKFDNAQKAREARRKTQNVVIKEMKYRLKIGPGDFETKTKKVSKFLSEGHKVKITIMFRGREMERPQYGRNLLARIASEVEGIGKIEYEPKMDNRNMIMVMAPEKRTSHKPDNESGGGGHKHSKHEQSPEQAEKNASNNSSDGKDASNGSGSEEANATSASAITKKENKE
jgi:translation initiation factor IF-3